jgi:aerobic-type carbon monoxide dehydrogenase small subunit (CoxS/CutS family)
MVEKLQRQPVKRSDLEAEIESALGQHICRCTGYVRYYQAAKLVIEDLGLVRED